MGRDATKAQQNVWYKARMEASKWDDRLCSREGAAERLGMSASAVADAELGLTKCMPVDKAVLMADLYRCPELLNYYCVKECPIGQNKPISYATNGIDRITVKVLKHLKLEELEQVKGKLLDIAEDGQITQDEIEDLQEIVAYFDELEKTISELRTVAAKAVTLYGGQ